jgi:membrane fusion protein (multidrug efflux system)
VVRNILIDSAQKVKQGDLLVQLDVTKEQADLKSAQSRLASSKAERDRLVKLAHESLGSQSQADSAVGNYDSLLAQIQSLKATIARREIRAPFSGITGIIQVQLGQYLSAGSKVVRLEDIDTMKLRFTVGEDDYSKIAIDMPLNLRSIPVRAWWKCRPRYPIAISCYAPVCMRWRKSNSPVCNSRS